MDTIAGWKGRPYVEAFPEISLNSVRRAWRAGRRFIQWTDEHGTITGHVEIVELTATRLVLRHVFFGTPNIEAGSGTTTFDLQSRSVNPARNAVEITCPNDGARTDRIYYVRGSWACRSCHHLGHLIQRLSPNHKIIFKIDALSLKLEQASSRRRRGRNYQRDILDLKHLKKMANPLCHLPEQLQFRSEGRWLDDGIAPKLGIAADDKEYGWKLGDRSGFKAFWARPPVAVQSTQMARISLPADPRMTGNRLFRDDIMEFIRQHFAESARLEAEHTLQLNPQITPEELALEIQRAIRICPLSIHFDEIFTSTYLPNGMTQLAVALKYSGDANLWFCKVAGTFSSPKLRAIVGDVQLSFSIDVPPHRTGEANRVLDLGLALIRQQVAAQASTVSRYNSEVAHNSMNYAEAFIRNHIVGKGDRPIRIVRK